MQNEKWSRIEGQINLETTIQNLEISNEYIDSNETELHFMFEYLNSDSMSFNTIEYISLFNLLANHQKRDYEELLLNRRRNGKRKKGINKM